MGCSLLAFGLQARPTVSAGWQEAGVQSRAQGPHKNSATPRGATGALTGTLCAAGLWVAAAKMHPCSQNGAGGAPGVRLGSCPGEVASHTQHPVARPSRVRG